MKTKKKKIRIEAGTCPKCGARNLDYGMSEIEDELVRYEYVCPDCGIDGVEWHRMEFSSHAVVKRGAGAKYLGYEHFEATK